MELLHLPTELFRMCLEQTVLTLGLKDSLRVRLVCKFMSHEVIRAIAAVRLLEQMPAESLPSSNLFYDLSRRYFLTEYLYYRVMSDRTSKDNLPAAIHESVDFILSNRNQEVSNGLRPRYIRVLCAAAARISFLYVILPSLESGCGDRPEHLRFSRGNHTLAAAAYLGDDELVQRLLQNVPVDLLGCSYFGRPINCAAAQGHYSTTRLLLEAAPSSLPERRVLLSSALKAAALEGHEDVVRLIMDILSQIPCTRKCIFDAVRLAARGGYGRFVESLTEKAERETPRAMQRLQNGILVFAARDGHEEVAHIALSKGAKPDHDYSPSKPGLYTPFVLAASGGHDKILQVLIDAGGGNQILYEQAMFQAVRRGYKRVVQVLLDNGYDLSAASSLAEIPPLVAAAKNGQAEMVQFLLSKGLDIKSNPGLCDKAISVAVENGYESVVGILSAFRRGASNECV